MKVVEFDMLENAIYRAIKPLPEMPNQSNLIWQNVNMEKIGGTQDVESEKYFYKIIYCPDFGKLIGLYHSRISQWLFESTHFLVFRHLRIRFCWTCQDELQDYSSSKKHQVNLANRVSGAVLVTVTLTNRPVRDSGPLKTTM